MGKSRFSMLWRSRATVSTSSRNSGWRRAWRLGGRKGGPGALSYEEPIRLQTRQNPGQAAGLDFRRRTLARGDGGDDATAGVAVGVLEALARPPAPHRRGHDAPRAAPVEGADAAPRRPRGAHRRPEVHECLAEDGRGPVRPLPQTPDDPPDVHIDRQLVAPEREG